MKLDFFLDLAEKFFSPKPGSLKVLVLEDDQDDREAICRVVRSEGFEPIWFASQADAEHSMSSNKYAAGIFDLKLINGSGKKALATFEMMFPDVVSLVVTGDKEAVITIVQDGTGIVLKGTDFKAITKSIRRILRPIKLCNTSSRWTTREVLLFILLLVSSFVGGWYTCKIGKL